MIFMLVILVVASAPVAHYIYGEYQRRKLINPAIYPAFMRIENYSLRYLKSSKPNRQEYTRCSRVTKEFFHLRRHNDIYSPNSSEYYGFIRSLQFKQPPYFLEKPASGADKRWAREEVEKLRREQDEILIKLYHGRRPGD